LIGDWAEKNHRNIIFKVHPCDTTEKVADAVNARTKNSRYLSRHNGSIHTLIQSAMGVVVINSGTGFESLIHGSPVATFGSCDYKWATFAMTCNNLDNVDNYFVNYSQKQQMNTYRFLYHYFYHYAFETRNTVDTSVRVRVKAIIQQAIDNYHTE
jgi:capsule polysaccharide modification protein KpsS